MTAQTFDMFAGVLKEIANGPRVSSFQGLTADLLRRLSEKGLTLEQCADRRMLNRSRSTLEGHCRKFGVRFPDYTPSTMRKHVMFVERGDFHELTGSEVEPVADLLGIVTMTRNCEPMCSVPAHSFDAAKETLRAAGYAAKSKAAKRSKAVANG